MWAYELLMQSRSQEDQLEKGMATQSSILALEILWDHKELDTTAFTHTQKWHSWGWKEE